jgi:hypothetical protein
MRSEMSETKTYRNVTISDGGKGIVLYERTPSGTGAPIADSFMFDEWDVEITFTRKPRPIQVGDRVRNMLVMCEGVVLAVWPDSASAFGDGLAWVCWDDWTPPTSSLLHNLKRVED